MDTISSQSAEFVLMNTQRGKTQFSKQLILKHLQSDNYYVVFFVLDNNTALAIQTQEAISNGLEQHKTFALHSLSNNIEPDIIQHINLMQHGNDYAPFIFALNNIHQIPRLKRIMQHAKTLGFKTLLVVDEADKTYPLCRDTLYQHTDRWIFVSATLGKLIHFPECAAAPIKRPTHTTITSPYRGFITQDARVMEFNTVSFKEDDALRCIRDRRNYFFEQVRCHDGNMRHRKVLIHGSTIMRMIQLTKELAAEGWGVVCVIGPGTFAAKNGQILAGVKNRKITVAQSIAALCIQYQLHTDRPLAVIGNRKMDRGITYHNWDDGFIFTDCILGNVNNTDTAVQKAGRLAGNIAHRPEFPSIITWWANAQTIQNITMQIQHSNAIDTNIFNMHFKGKFHIHGPFDSYQILNKHKFLTQKNNKLYIHTGAKLLHNYNISIHTFILHAIKYNTPLAAQILNKFYIITIH